MIPFPNKKYSISNELEFGKLGEHLVCADLIKKGYIAFLTDAGLPYDIICVINKEIKRIQVKTTLQKTTIGKSFNVYRFGTRHSKGTRQRVNYGDMDYFAFVAVDINKIGYVKIEEMVLNGKIKTLIEFRDRNIKYNGRIYSNGTIRHRFGKFIQDYENFP